MENLSKGDRVIIKAFGEGCHHNGNDWLIGMKMIYVSNAFGTIDLCCDRFGIVVMKDNTVLEIV